MRIMSIIMLGLALMTLSGCGKKPLRLEAPAPAGAKAAPQVVE